MKTLKLLKHVFLACALSLIGPTANAAVYVLEVPSTSPWYDTGIDVAAGDQLTVSASQFVFYGYTQGQVSDPDGYGPYTVDFTTYTLSVFPNTMGVSLIGKIGGTTDVGTGVPLTEGAAGMGAGFVGRSYDQVAIATGRLFLGFNDQVGGFWDNSRAFSTIVTVVPVPEPSVAAIMGLGLCFFGRKMMRRK